MMKFKRMNKDSINDNEIIKIENSKYIIKEYEDMFLFKDEKNKLIYDNYLSCKKDKSNFLGVYKFNNVIVTNNWGFAARTSTSEYINLLDGLGWQKEHLNHISMRQEHFLFDKNEILHFNENKLDDTKIDHTCALLSFPGALTFGHWIVDIIFRIYFLKITNIWEKIDYFLLPEPTTKWMKPFLEISGIENERIIHLNNKNFLKIDTLYAPTTASHLTGGTLPNAIAEPLYNFFQEIIAYEQESNQTEIVFLVHTAMTSGKERDIYGFEKLEEYLKKLHVRIIDPLKMSFDELIQVLNNAKLVIGQDSSSLHNLAFANCDLIVIESEPRANLLHLSIQDIKKRKIFYLSSIKENDKWYFDIDTIIKYIKKYISRIKK